MYRIVRAVAAASAAAPNAGPGAPTVPVQVVAKSDRGWLQAERIGAPCVDSYAVFALKWSVPGAQQIEIHLTTPDGPLFTRAGADGTAVTPQWVTSGMVFYLQDTSPLRKNGAEATVVKLETNFQCP